MTPTVVKLPRRCFKVTRPFSPRVPFRRPRPQAVQIVEYGIAVAANTAGVAMHEYGVEARRLRMVLSAIPHELRTFMESLDAVISGCSDNSSRFWRQGAAYTAVPLTDDQAVLDATVDVLASARRHGRGREPAPIKP